MADLPGTLESDLASGLPADHLVPCDVAGMGDVAVALRAHAAVLENCVDALSYALATVTPEPLPSRETTSTRRNITSAL